MTEATEPIRTRDPNASTGQARDTANLLSDGYTSFQLLYVFPSPEVMEGHRVEAKGFLIRGNQDALNVTSAVDAYTGLSVGPVRPLYLVDVTSVDGNA